MATWHILLHRICSIAFCHYGWFVYPEPKKVHSLIPDNWWQQMWHFMLNSGVHATITGVLVAFVIYFVTEARRHLPIDSIFFIRSRFLYSVILP
jgi:hypothetical protein